MAKFSEEGKHLNTLQCNQTAVVRGKVFETPRLVVENVEFFLPLRTTAAALAPDAER